MTRAASMPSEAPCKFLSVSSFVVSNLYGRKPMPVAPTPRQRAIAIQIRAPSVRLFICWFLLAGLISQDSELIPSLHGQRITGIAWSHAIDPDHLHLRVDQVGAHKSNGSRDNLEGEDGQDRW